MLRKFITILLYLSLPGTVLAQPEIASVNGTYVHDRTVTITGTGFGSKNPAAPLVWDDCTNNTPLNTHYDCYLPTEAQQGSNYNMSYHTDNFRGITVPHGRVNYFLGGAHATDAANGQYRTGGNVLLGKAMTSFKFYLQYWYRIDPAFDEENNPTAGDNMKELDLSEDPDGAYGGAFGYYGFCGSHVPDKNFKNPVKLTRIPAELPDLPYACTPDNYTVYHTNPINSWVKMQWEGDYNSQLDVPTVKFTTYPDGKSTYQSHYGGDITTSNIYAGQGNPKEGNLRMVSLGGFARVPRTDNGVNSFRYFAGIYIDSTRARVMLGDHQDYASCTVMEPQIPSAWNQNEITCSVNLGAFSDSGTAYLFVFDEHNNHNMTGFPLTLGASGGDTIPPASPEGLRIVD